NCAHSIEQAVRAARAHVAEVLVVDDGSADDTATRATAAGASVVSHPQNRGKGAALESGFKWYAAQDTSRVLTMDGDGQHLSSQIPILLEASNADPNALVIGARRVESQTVAPIKLFGNRFANRWVEIACGMAIPDTQSGFRIYPVTRTIAL